MKTHNFTEIVALFTVMLIVTLAGCLSAEQRLEIRDSAHTAILEYVENQGTAELTEYIDHKFRIGLGKRYFVPTVPRDRHGNPVDLTEVIARVDGVKAAKEMMAARLPQCGGTDKKN